MASPCHITVNIHYRWFYRPLLFLGCLTGWHWPIKLVLRYGITMQIGNRKWEAVKLKGEFLDGR